jgi:hypothetical protein
MEAGATAPFGYFDPLGLSKDKSVAEIKKWRESEVKHGRVAMLATLGVFIQEKFSPFYSKSLSFYVCVCVCTYTYVYMSIVYMIKTANIPLP